MYKNVTSKHNEILENKVEIIIKLIDNLTNHIGLIER